jgi:hypothetical protein
MTLPIGSIVASILNLTDFKKLMPSGESWELADGTSLQITNKLASLIHQGGPDYAALVLNNTAMKPNLNGAFLRGRDYTPSNKPNAFRNPDGLLLVGEYRGDTFAKHSHQTDQVANNDSAHNGTTSNGAWYGKKGNDTGLAGDTETRPKNVTVNFFIRVN